MLAAAAMAMSSVSVVTNALRLRGFRRPASAAAILHPPLGERVGEYAYLVGIALVALAIGVAALILAQPSHDSMGASQHGDMMAPTLSAADAGVHADLIAPDGIAPGQFVSLTVSADRCADWSPLGDIVESHERPMHLIAVSRICADSSTSIPSRPCSGRVSRRHGVPGAGHLPPVRRIHAGERRDVVSATTLTVGAHICGKRHPDRRPRAEDLDGPTRVTLQGADALRVNGAGAADVPPGERADRAASPRSSAVPRAPAHAVIIDQRSQHLRACHGEAVGDATGDARISRPPGSVRPGYRRRAHVQGPRNVQALGSVSGSRRPHHHADFVVRVSE